MNRYVLTAALNGRTNAHTMKCDDGFEATIEAIAWIMDHAYEDKTGAWAVGAIKLYGPDGSVLHEMEAK